LGSSSSVRRGCPVLETVLAVLQKHTLHLGDRPVT
jgi:hypothetical protein